MADLRPLLLVFCLICLHGGESARLIEDQYRDRAYELAYNNIWGGVTGRVFKINGDEKVAILKYVGWQEANEICESIGLKLVSFQTKEKWNAIRNFLSINRSADKWFWTSGRKDGDGWKWSATNETASYLYWKHDQPNVAGDDACIIIVPNQPGWYDGDCVGGDKNAVLCE